MRKLTISALPILAFMAALFIPQGVQAEPAPSSDSPAEAVVKGSPAPRLAFSELEHDFGTLGQKEEVKHIFNFRNDGDAPLIISEVKATCGCTGVLLSKSEIPPGEEGQIEVTFKSGTSSGKKKKRIDVHSNDPKTPSAKLFIAANIIVPVEVKPRALYWLAEKGAMSQRKVELLYQPGHETEIIRLESSSPAFKATFRPKEGGDTLGYDIDMEFDGSLPVGDVRERLTIVTGNPEHERLQVRINGRVTGPIRVVPNSINFGALREGDPPPPRLIRVFAKNKQDFEITAIESANPLISTEITRDESLNGYTVTVRLADMPPKGGFSEKMVIHTDWEDEDPLQIAVYAFIR